jgi:hypothetical protein
VTIELASDRPDTLPADTIGAAWLAVARRILADGIASRYDEQPVREISLVTLVVARPDPADEIIARYAEPERLAWMHANFTDPAQVAVLGGADSYATRLFDYEHSGRDQVAWVIDRLRDDPATRSAAITTFQPHTDTSYIPCVSLLDFWLPGGAVELVGYAHSIDFGAKGYGNLVELAALQQHVAGQLGRAGRTAADDGQVGARLRDRTRLPARRAGPGRPRASTRSGTGVVAGAVPVHQDHRLVSHHPGVVTLRQRGDIAGPGVELGAVGHHDVQRSGRVVLEVRRLAQVGARDRLDVVRPAPAGLQGEPADFGAADLDEVHGAVGERAGLVGGLEALLLRFAGHGQSPFSCLGFVPGDQRGRPGLQPPCTELVAGTTPGL